MSDRQVRQIFPELKASDAQQVRQFSEYAESPNIVLLGDPGAGKTHLFDSAARAEGGRFFTTRDFLNTPSFQDGKALFIDALDEKRAGRADGNTIDAVVQKLFLVQPAKVRISCRVADWLGATDLVAFRPFFDGRGGSVVLELRALTDVEQHAVLRANGVADPIDFIAQAHERGLVDFLDNPQNLVLLSQAVRGGVWPRSRKQLFDLATQVLLREHNETHSRTGGGVFSPAELLDAAGSICALRLLTDVSGISLAANATSPDFPSFRSIEFASFELVEAALSRRAFRAAGPSECVDYAHRTTAEYLAGRWLANKVRTGLPVGRVLALIGIDGHPASELRGLHAWLAVFLPEHSKRLIDADPYGVLTYGDAASIDQSSRVHLLDALARLSASDPWFRSGHRESAALGALSQPEMCESFRAILRSDDSNSSLRSIVVDALAVGQLVIEMQDDLLALLWRRKSPLAEQVSAVIALTRMGHVARAAVAASCRAHNDIHASALRLSAVIMEKLFVNFFNAADVAGLMARTLLSNDDELPSGSYWSLPNGIPLTDATDVLDHCTHINLEGANSHRNTWEVVSVVERLLLRVFRGLTTDPSPERALSWFLTRAALREASFHGEELAELLRRRPLLLQQMIRHLFATMRMDDHRWMAIHNFRNAVFGAITAELLVTEGLRVVRDSSSEPERKHFFYELVLSFSFGSPALNMDVFERVYLAAEGDARLMEVRRQQLAWDVNSWHGETIADRARRAAQEKLGRDETVRSFNASVDAVRSGGHLGWLDWAASIYFGHFQDVPEKAEPVSRLVSVLGDESTAVAIDGLVALLHRNDIPSIQDVAAAAAEQQYPRWWLAIIAGLDEAWKRTPALASFSNNLLRVGVAINVAIPTFRGEDNRELAHGWHTSAALERRQLTEEAYLALARAGLRRGGSHVAGLIPLLQQEPSSSFGGVLSSLLREFPNSDAVPLEEMLRRAVSAGDTLVETATIAREVLEGSTPLGDRQRDLWLAAAYIAAPDDFEKRTEARASMRPELIWSLRAMAASSLENAEHRTSTLSLRQLEVIARVTGRAFPNGARPTGASWGDTSVWNASEFLRALVTQMSTDASEASTAALARLRADRSLLSYRDLISHNLANQKRARRDAAYRQPDWEQSIATLQNGPPASVNDLHALLVDQLRDIAKWIGSDNSDPFKLFWNVNSRGGIETQRPENECRDVLLTMLRTRLYPKGVVAEPEGHMARDRRADIAVATPGKKILVELKRDSHPNVWTAIEGQLDEYTRDPESLGFGVYGVFWFGGTVRSPRRGKGKPQTPGQMESQLRDGLAAGQQARIEVIVIDVSGAA